MLLRLLSITLAPTLLLACADEAPLDLETCDAPETYRIRNVQLPENNAEAKALGFDLDDNTSIDNWLGQVMGAVQGLWQPPLEAQANAHLAGDVDWRVALRRCPDERLAVAVHRAGAEPVYVVTEPGERLARGTGGVEVPLGALSDGLGTASPGWIGADFSAIEVGDPDAPALALRIGAALEATESTAIVLDAFAPFLDETLRSPTREEVDDDGDGNITAAEVADTSIARSLLVPDLRLQDDRRGLSLAVSLVAEPL